MDREKQDPAKINDCITAFDEYFQAIYPSEKNKLAVRKLLESAFFAGVAWGIGQHKYITEILNNTATILENEKKHQKIN